MKFPLIATIGILVLSSVAQADLRSNLLDNLDQIFANSEYVGFTFVNNGSVIHLGGDDYYLDNGKPCQIHITRTPTEFTLSMDVSVTSASGQNSFLVNSGKFEFTKTDTKDAFGNSIVTHVENVYADPSNDYFVSGPLETYLYSPNGDIISSFSQDLSSVGDSVTIFATADETLTAPYTTCAGIKR